MGEENSHNLSATTQIDLHIILNDRVHDLRGRIGREVGPHRLFFFHLIGHLGVFLSYGTSVCTGFEEVNIFTCIKYPGLPIAWGKDALDFSLMAKRYGQADASLFHTIFRRHVCVADEEGLAFLLLRFMRISPAVSIERDFPGSIDDFHDDFIEIGDVGTFRILLCLDYPLMVTPIKKEGDCSKRKGE
ncbi:MAG: hypothetical protein R3231_01165 [bacterium]|nr:hypothetical protein [bacterium]